MYRVTIEVEVEASSKNEAANLVSDSVEVNDTLQTVDLLEIEELEDEFDDMEEEFREEKKVIRKFRKNIED